MPSTSALGVAQNLGAAPLKLLGLFHAKVDREERVQAMPCKMDDTENGRSLSSSFIVLSNISALQVFRTDGGIATCD